MTPSNTGATGHASIEISGDAWSSSATNIPTPCWTAMPIETWSCRVGRSSRCKRNAYAIAAAYRHGTLHDCTRRVVEAMPGKKVEWLVTDGYSSFTNDKHEWKDTRVTFEITGKPGATELHFTDIGVTSESECFEKCSKGCATSSVNA